MSTTFDSIINRLSKIQQLLNLTDVEVRLLSTHKKISYQELEVAGQKYPAWRVIHNDALGPGKGGIRFHPEVSEDEVKSLSCWMSLKNSLADLPYGGAKGGIKFNPKDKSNQELEQISRAYIQAFHENLGENKDIPAPDVYTNAQTMSWMLDEFEKITGHHEPGMITGKPLELGGLALRQDATARGGCLIMDEVVKSHNLAKENLTIAIQGFGNAGANLALMLREAGYQVVAVSDSQGAIYNPRGLNIHQVIKIKEQTGKVGEYQDAEKISQNQLLELDVDFLVLAALENVITQENAGKIQAKRLLELANGPITPEADQILNNKIEIIPDILANSGGVIVSFFEWTQNRTGGICPANHLKSQLELKLKTAWDKIHTISHDKNIDLRAAAWIAAIQRILAATKWRGNLK